MPDIFAYTDYKQYLLDCFLEKKATSPAYSRRLLAGRLGISSSTLSRILKGKRNLSRKQCPVFVKHLELDDKEAEYFSLMALSAQVKGSGNKTAIFQRMLDLRSERIKKVNLLHYSIFEKWYMIALREIIDIKGKIDDINSISQSLRPSIPAGEAEKAVDILKKLKVIKEDKNGRFRASEKLLTTGERWNDDVIKKFQGEMIHLANNALADYPKSERDFSTLTIGLSSEEIAGIKEILKRTRQEILALIEGSSKREYVYQLNIQFFPISNCLNEVDDQ